MDIGHFATKHRLHVKRDECGETIVVGKRGHIYQHGDSLFGLLFMPGRPRLWAHARRKLQAAGFTIRQNGDEEGAALFDPSNGGQVQLALTIVGAKPKRIPSAAQLEALRKATEARRTWQTQRAEAAVAP